MKIKFKAILVVTSVDTNIAKFPTSFSFCQGKRKKEKLLTLPQPLQNFILLPTAFPVLDIELERVSIPKSSSAYNPLTNFYNPKQSLELKVTFGFVTNLQKSVFSLSWNF